MQNQFSPRGLPRQGQRRADGRRLNFKAVAREALAQGHFLVSAMLPGGRMEGQEYVVRNPLRPDNAPGSFKVNLRTGHWADFATDSKGRDLISLTAYLLGISQGKAAWRVVKDLGLDGANWAPGVFEYDR
jgi:hypothetical protein